MNWDTTIESYEYKGYTIEIHYDEDPMNPLKDWDMLGKFIVLGNDRDYGHLSTGSLSDYGVYERQYYSGYFRETDAGEEVEIESDDLVEHIEKATRGVVLEVSLSGPMQREWCDGLLVMTRDEIAREISIYRKGFDEKRREIYTQFRTCNNEKPIGDKSRRVWTEWFNDDTGNWTQNQYWFCKHVRVTEADRERAREMLNGQSEVLRSWFSGEVYGFITKDPYGDNVDSVWGFFGNIDDCEKEAENSVDEDIEHKEEEIAKDIDRFLELTNEEVA